jgi:hypothetical protein
MATSISEEASAHLSGAFALLGVADSALCDWTFGEAVLVFEQSASHHKDEL